MIQFPNCKINLGLSITQKREDGYHHLDTVFYPIQLKDALEFVVSDELKLDITGLNIPGPIEDNIILKAYHLLKQDFNHLPPLHIHLHKTIPTGGGLGGGSSNGAFMLKMLNEYFNLGIEENELALNRYALKLGSDCPFFILNKPCHALGRGELLEPITLDLSDYHFVLVFSGIHIPTGWAFSQLIPQEPDLSTKEIISHPISSWQHLLKNDFEKPIFNTHPLLFSIKNKLIELGASYASMSGSGSTMFGIFKKESMSALKENIQNDLFFKDLGVYFVE